MSITPKQVYARVWLAAFVICLALASLAPIVSARLAVSANSHHAAPNPAPPAGLARAQDELAAPDAHTLLLLHFNGSLTGVQGEQPTQAQGTSFVSGVAGQGVLVDGADVLKYATLNNFNAAAGSLEFWLKPLWNGNDGASRCLFTVGNNEFVLVKDGGNNFRFIIKGDDSEAYHSYQLASWVANQWHHIAVTWTIPGEMKTYFDGKLAISHAASQQDLLSPLPAELILGGNNGACRAEAVLDELRISDIARSPQEIAKHLKQGLTINGWSFDPPTINIKMYPGWSWWATPGLIANTPAGTLTLPTLAANWVSSNPGVASMEATGRIKAEAPGSATLTAALGRQLHSLAVEVLAPARPPTVETIDPYLATPARDYLYRMPVAIIRYLPTRNGVDVDAEVSGYVGTLAGLKSRLENREKQKKFMLEEGSRFRGYKALRDPTNPPAHPSLGYQVVKIITVYEDLPPGPDLNGDGISAPDYHQILTRWGGAQLVNELGVKEFWLWQYHYGRLAPIESNMSSPTTNDISNGGGGNDDMPIYNRTYVVYGLNFGTGANEAVHDHGHQLERIYGFVSQLQDGNPNLFWRKFSGRDDNDQTITGRCGNTHTPPNTLADYDYGNATEVLSDIEDWTPANLGEKKSVSAATWRSIPYAFPYDGEPVEPWYVYWMQAMPGRGNRIPHGGNQMTNWWHFTGDWDASIKAGLGLYEPGSCNYTLSATTGHPASTNGGPGSVNVSSGSGCKWIASSNVPWIIITSPSFGNGDGTVRFSVAANAGTPRAGTIAIAGKLFTVKQAGTFD